MLQSKIPNYFDKSLITFKKIFSVIISPLLIDLYQPTLPPLTTLPFPSFKSTKVAEY